MSMKDDIEKKFNKKLLWNAKIFLKSFVVALAALHHAAFYSFPPDFDMMLSVPPQAYILITILVFIFLKSIHRDLEKAEILGNGN